MRAIERSSAALSVNLEWRYSHGAFVRNDRVVARNTLRPNSHRDSDPARSAACRTRWRDSRRVPIHSSVEIGYRVNDVTGSGDMYDTLVNLQSGPRILDQTLSMQSVDHQGLLFDDLYLNSFGWGGDPNNALRLRADKNKWYNLQSSFRRDQYFSITTCWRIH